MRADSAIACVRLDDGTGLAAIHQRLQAACQLLALVVRQLGQAVDQARHLLLSHGLLLGLDATASCFGDGGAAGLLKTHH